MYFIHPCRHPAAVDRIYPGLAASAGASRGLFSPRDLASRVALRFWRKIAAGLFPFMVAAPALAQVVGISSLARPLFISHRGDMGVYPEETMEAYRASVNDGAQFVEVDCHKLPDGTLAIIHDDTLDRTTNRKGNVTSITSLAAWRQVFVQGDKLVPPHPGKVYPAPTLDDVLEEFGNKVILVIEAKNTGAGDLIVSALKSFNVSRDRVLVNSFDAVELLAAKAAGYLTCLNMGSSANILPNDFAYDYLALSQNAPESLIRQAVDARIKVIIYTVNRQYLRDKFLSMGVEGFYSDDAPYLQGSFNITVRSAADPYGKQTWYHGQLPTTPEKLGRFVAPAKWGFAEYASGKYYGCIQGWCSPLNHGNASADFSIEFDITMGETLSADRWAGIFLAGTDHPLDNDSAPSFSLYGYHFLAAKDGRLLVYRYEGGGPQLHTLVDTGRPISTGETIRCVVTRSNGSVVFSRRDVATSVTFAGGNLQAVYVTLGSKGANVDFSNVRVTTSVTDVTPIPSPPVEVPTTVTPNTTSVGKGAGGGAPSVYMLGLITLIAGFRLKRRLCLVA